MKNRSAFTLIELLIVVAIIAILAAIAVPNFLEAQTRSRISRAMNDLRTISVAMESYRIDNNSYIPRRSDAGMGRSGDIGEIRKLTTPIAYCSAVPDDVFLMIAGQPQSEYRIYTPGYRVSTVNTVGYVSDYQVYPHTAWMTWSIGPDLLTNAGGYRTLPVIIANEGSNPPGIGKDKNGEYITSNNTYTGMRYDATNGTISYGDIYRHEGEAITRVN